MTKQEYVRKLAELYYIANLSDSDSPQRPDWLRGDECSIHCQALDSIVRDMGLSDIWGNLLEGDCFDRIPE